LARKIAVANMKGGVGKTTLSIMLAETLAHKDKSVLLIDLDAQGSLSYALMGDEKFEQTVDADRTISRYFSERVAPRPRPLGDFITPRPSLLSACSKLELIAAEPGLQTEERNVISHLTRFAIGNAFNGFPEKTASGWIKSELKDLDRKYEYIIFDCPPGISIFAFAGIQNSDHVLVPATPDYLSLLAIKSMQSRVLPAAAKGRPKKTPQKISLVLNKCRETTKSQKIYRRRIIEFIDSTKWKAELAPIQIPLNVQLARATESDDDREWATFGEKYDTFYADQLAELFL
jgi:chromosome partitioning protein